jgi:hypothetical protein
MNGSYNIAYGLDGRFRIKGDEYLILKMAQSIENDADNKFRDCLSGSCSNGSGEAR